MTVDNQPAGDLFGKSLPVGDFQAAIYAQVLTTLQRQHVQPVLLEEHEPDRQEGRQQLHPHAASRRSTSCCSRWTASSTRTSWPTAGKAASKISADNVISLPIDPLPTILLWNSQDRRRRRGQRARSGPFWNMNTWGVKLNLTPSERSTGPPDATVADLLAPASRCTRSRSCSSRRSCCSSFVRTTFDPTARLAASRDPEVRIREQQRLGLDDPLVTQYGRWLGDAVTGDFGQSEIVARGRAPRPSGAAWATRCS